MVHAPRTAKVGKLVKGERFLFGETLCGKDEDRLADFADEVTCPRCLKTLGRKKASPRAIILGRTENVRI